MNLTDKQKKGLWILAGVLVIIHFFLPGIVTTVRHAFTHTAPAVLPKPSPAVPMPPPAPPSSTVNQKLIGYYSGVWMGSMTTAKFDKCDLRLELRQDQEDLTKMMGYLTKTCVPFANIQHRSASSLVLAANPETSVMVGVINADSIVFAIDQTTGMQPGDCPLSAFSTRIFGLTGLNAEWKQGNCSSGTAMLIKKG